MLLDSGQRSVSGQLPGIMLEKELFTLPGTERSPAAGLAVVGKSDIPP